jgi:hypothetical protein
MMAPMPDDDFISRVRAAEERLFRDRLDPADATRLLHDGYSWHYRPSHHAATGLVTSEDFGKTILSIGAHPACFERILVELGLPRERLLVADHEPRLPEEAPGLRTIVFDVTEPWPEIGAFDLIVFPESLCIALADRIDREGRPAPTADDEFPADAREAELLAGVLMEALGRLKRGGEIRANGPQSHPNVVTAARAVLERQGFAHELEYERYFLIVRPLVG